MSHSSIHKIQEIAFDIRFDDQSKGHVLMGRISTLFRQSLIDILNEVLSSSCPAEMVWRIDELELDLGHIPLKNIEKELPKIFRETLLLQLPEYATQDARSRQHVQKHLLSESRLDALIHFLQSGALPWWAHKQSFHATSVIEDLLTKNPKSFSRKIRNLTHKAIFIKRLVLQFSGGIIQKIIQVLEPEEASLIIAFSLDIQQLHQQQTIVKATPSQFNNDIWEFILSYLLIDRGTTFNTKSFITSILKKLAKRYRLAYQSLLGHLSLVLEQLQKKWPVKSLLPTIISDLYQEQTKTSHKEVQASTIVLQEWANIAAPEEVIYWLFFLKHGYWPAVRPNKTWKQLEQQLLLYLDKAPPLFIRQFRILIQNQRSKKRLILQSKINTLWKLLELMIPDSIREIRSIAQLFVQIEKQQAVFELSPAIIQRNILNIAFQKISKGEIPSFYIPTGLHTIITSIANSNNTSTTIVYQKIQSSLKHLSDIKGMEKATKQFKQIIQHEEIRNIPSNTVAKNYWSHLEQFCYFLQFGLIPLSAHQAAFLSLNELLDELLEKDVDRLVIAVRREGQREMVRRRIVEQLPKKYIHALVMGILPADGAAVIQYVYDINFLQQKGDIISTDNSSFNKQVWYVVLSYLLVERGSYFNKRMFLKQNLEQLAAHYHLRFRTLIRLLLKTLDQLQMPVEWELEKSLRSFYLEAEKEHITKDQATATKGIFLQSKIPDLSDYYEDFVQFIQTAKWASKALPKEVINQLLVSMMKYMPQKLHMLLKNAPHKKTVVQLLVTQASVTIQKHLLYCLYPNIANTIIQLQEDAKAAIAHLKKGASNIKKTDHLIWTTIWEYLINEPEDVQLHHFLNGLSHHLSQGLNLEQAALIQQLEIEIQQSNTLEHYAGPAGKIWGLKNKKQTSHQKLQQAEEKRLIHLLENKHREIILQEIIPVIHKLKKKTSPAVALSITNSLKRSYVLKRVIDRKSINLYKQLTYLLMPRNEAAKIIKAYQSLFQVYCKRIHLISQSKFLKLYWEHYFLYRSSVANASQFRWNYFLKSFLHQLSLQASQKVNLIAHHLSLHLNQVQGPLRNQLDAICQEINPPLKEEEPYRKLGEKKERIMISEPIFIDNAGLILCWPFFSQFFKMLKLEDMKDPDQAKRAIHYLQYLVNGQTASPEYELALNKLLCGISLEEPVIREIEITEEEKDLCDQLLNAGVIKNWPPVQNTSQESFQQSFLQREGKITETEGCWLLQVEKKAFDLLLQQLPWRLSPVFFSWMDKKIEVEWG
ncbi:MAG: hypothetical protein MI974_00165 [Chitinophagales bacterium]|nr:hypothetical protein [Chitinophagales bacterium]